MNTSANASATTMWEVGTDDWPACILFHCRQAAATPIRAKTAKKKPAISSTKIRVVRAAALPMLFAAATPPRTAW